MGIGGAAADVMGDLGSQFGIINSLRTGNVMIDMLVCMCVPLFFQLLNYLWDHVGPAITKYFEELGYDKTRVTKIIEHESRTDLWGDEISSPTEVRNNILQKAISLYLGELGDLKMQESTLSLMAVKEKSTYNEDIWEKEYGTTADQLEQYSVNTLPPDDVWIDLRPNLKFKQYTEDDDDGKKKEKNIIKATTYFKFRSSGPDAEKTIDTFIQEASDWYKARMVAMEDKGRYLYMLVKGGSKDSDASRVYKRYQLADAKTFKCLFFREKELLLQVLGHFKEKTGKYAIQGFPHKLGLLLHGPPGTGKTSLIKAMAQHTGRNVVSVPLARIETNQELMDIVFDQSFAVKGEDMPIKLSFKDIIFVMEDVDAASPIVHSRSGDKSGDSTTKVILEKAGGPEKVELTKQVSNSAAETSSAGVGGDVVDLGEGGDAGLMMAMLSSVMDSGSGDKKGLDYKSSKYMSKYDKLDLSGLLNVLDGVVDCPNRILIMTTNHPEKLDPALIRPGRIDKIIYLGYLQAPEAKEMVEHYFGDELTTPQWNRLEAALGSPPGMADFTPAEVEQLCAEYDEVDEFLTALEERVLDECEKNMQKTQLHTSASTLSRHDDMPPPAPLKRGLSTTSKVSNVSTSFKTSENPIVNKALRAASTGN